MYTENWQATRDGDEASKMQAPLLGVQAGLTKNGEVYKGRQARMNACRTRRVWDRTSGKRGVGDGYMWSA